MSIIIYAHIYEYYHIYIYLSYIYIYDSGTFHSMDEPWKPAGK